MKKQLINIFMVVFAAGWVNAQQDFSAVLAEIEKNNTTLQALSQKAEAQKLESHTGIWLQNPEAGFNYLWGNPGEIGTRTDFSVMQSFDFPLAYKYRSNIADLQTEQAMLEYSVEKRKLLYEAKLICIDLVYYNKLMDENGRLLAYAESIAEAVEKMYAKGRVNILEHNKAQLNLANISNDHGRLQAEARRLQAELTRMNGGKELHFEAAGYAPAALPGDFDAWFAGVESNNPLLQYMSREVSIHENEEKLNRALSLPKFEAGYMSEKVMGEKYQGLSVGLSIPLWENKNTVKAARAQAAAGVALMTDLRLQLYNQLKNSYNAALDLQRSSDAYSRSLEGVDNAGLLKKAYDLGEISLIEYLVEVQFYYETVIKAIESRREMHKAIAGLEKWN